jgi:EmrB/QacA subfamily drug resistance transporter
VIVLKGSSGTPATDAPVKRGMQYKYTVLTNTTLGVLMATLDSSIVMISLPQIFRGINLNPLAPANFAYLLWILMGYGLVVAVLVVTLGRIGDIFGRVRIYNLGFVVFTLASIGLSVVWSTGAAGAMEIIVFRMIQAVGGAMLMANSAAIITDVFPANERGMALGVNQIAALAGSFLGLVLGGILAAIDWRLVFLVNVPIGLFGTVWAYWKLHDTGERHEAKIDWLGMGAFAAGLWLVLLGVTNGITPYGTSPMGWGNPSVWTMIVTGLVCLGVFVFIESRVKSPMLDLGLFKIRAFAAGNLAVLLSQVANGGMQFMFIMWLQGIWLPLHGVSFEATPIWAGICMLPLTCGFLVAAPIFGRLSDKYGARPFTTAGMVLAAATFALFMTLPADFPYVVFGVLLFLDGLAFGMFSAPNTAAIMNSVPARNRGAASGVRATAQMTGQPLSMGIFFSIMVASLVASVPATMSAGLIAHHTSAAIASKLANMPPTGYLFAAFLGYNPLQSLLGPVLHTLPAADAAVLAGKEFFPKLISGPFAEALRDVLVFSSIMCAIAAVASWFRGGKFVHEEATHAHIEVVPEPAEAELDG